MFGRRRRKDGFEWREYVRTTILVRRKNRRERVGQAAKAAAGGLKEAGQRGVAAGAAAGAAGAHAMGRGAKAAGEQGLAASAASAHALGRGMQAAGRFGAAAGRQGLALGLAGARATNSGVRAGLPKVWDFMTACGRGLAAACLWVWRGVRSLAASAREGIGPVLAALGRGTEPIVDRLRQPGLALPLSVAGGVALGVAAARTVLVGFDGMALLALLVGIGVIAAVLAARWSYAPPAWLAWSGEWLSAGGHAAARGGAGLGAMLPSGLGVSVLRAGAAVLVAALGVGGFLLIGRALPSSSTLASLLPGSETVEGQAVAVTGDTMRIAGTTVRLDGIEAPALRQTCQSARGRTWRCGASAKSALARLTGYETVTCEFSGAEDGQGHKVASCHMGETDLAAELVREGHVFAETGFFSTYAAFEDEARDARAGIWRGEAERPSSYRAQRWEEAKREAPEGCPIKGNVNGGRRVYVLPWASGYERVQVSSRRGERWFCSEEEARAAGWEPSGQS
jgi:endonuclease YncB( thermonuclease family)